MRIGFWRAKTHKASEIDEGRFPVDRLPALTDEKIWKGTGGNVEEIDVPSAPNITTGTFAGNDTANRAIAHGLGATPILVLVLGDDGKAGYVLGTVALSVQVDATKAVTNWDGTNFYVTHIDVFLNQGGTNYTWLAVG